MNCYNCNHYDKNDYVHCYGTCELQDVDFRIDHKCNIEKDRVCYDSFHFGKTIGNSITLDRSYYDYGNLL